MVSALAEGLAVGALVLGGVSLVGTHLDTVQRAVVLGVAVVCAGLDGAFDALVCMAVHIEFPPLILGYGNSLPRCVLSITGNRFQYCFYPHFVV